MYKRKKNATVDILIKCNENLQKRYEQEMEARDKYETFLVKRIFEYEDKLKTQRRWYDISNNEICKRS